MYFYKLASTGGPGSMDTQGGVRVASLKSTRQSEAQFFYSLQLTGCSKATLWKITCITHSLQIDMYTSSKEYVHSNI